ncbi:MAG: hypothetical protein EOP52_03695 [Sphingobacteriales bacterium]|nr:MAG: hypothetical protein EOP52_03695 [Sphingobacteriales bacterium]
MASSDFKNLPTTIPAELRNQLPIFQVLGDKIASVGSGNPSNRQPTSKRPIATILFWALILGAAYWFVSNIDTILTTVEKTMKIVIFSIITLVLLLLAPKIIALLHRLGTMLLFKGEKQLIRSNPVEALQLLLREAKDTLKRVKDKIANVDGVRIDMIQSGQQAQQSATTKYTHAKRFTTQAAELEVQAETAQKEGAAQQESAARRDAKETRTKAYLLGKEGEAEEQNARSYAQYANQFAKVIEVLKDNESAARIYVSTLDSSITILQKKLEATNKMKNATDGLAEVFNIKDGWVFQEAMGAATAAISQNIASIRSNLEFLDQNAAVTVGGTPSQEELNVFMAKIDNSHLQKLNVAEIASSGHTLSESETIDKGFTLLD